MERLDGGGKYDLGRDWLGSARLNLQHYLWKESLGYDLHPSICPDGREGLRIADVGTGTGIFLLGLARRLPASCSFVGLDISGDQFPIPEWTPSNISFRVASATEEPPVDLQGQFDIVHVRLFYLVVENNDPLPMLLHCLKLLKPGGYLQWDEYDPANLVVTRASPYAPTRAINDMIQSFNSKRQVGWIERLDEFFIEEEMQNVQYIRTRPPHELIKAWSENMIIATMEHAWLHDAKGAVESGDRVRKVVSDCADELRRGGACNYMLQVVIGRKPAVGYKPRQKALNGANGFH